MTMPLLFKILVIWIYSSLLNTYTVTSFQPYHQPHSLFRSGTSTSTSTGTEFGRCTVNGNSNACNRSSDKILTFQKPKCSPTKMANSKGCNDDESSSSKSGGEESNEKRNGNGNSNGNDDGNGNGNSNGNDRNRNRNRNRNIPTIVDAYTPLLNKRLSKLRAYLLEEQIQKPPNPSLNPIQVITLILQELQEQNNGNTSSSLSSSSLSLSSFSMPESGFRTLLRSSTNIWKNALRKSVGAPNGATEEQLVSALSSAMSRPNNQYQILVGSDDDDDDDDDDGNDDNNHDKDGNDKNYHLYFPGDVFEYDDGKAWVESQLRHPKTGKLLAILAWSLIQRESDGAWLIDWLDWQDFRDEYRPGIGREEWSRICG